MDLVENGNTSFADLKKKLCIVKKEHCPAIIMLMQRVAKKLTPIFYLEGLHHHGSNGWCPSIKGHRQ